MVMPGPGFPRLGSLLEMMAKRSPFGSHENSVTASVRSEMRFAIAVSTVILRTLELDDFYREVLLPDTEDLEVAKDGLLGFGVAVDFNTEEIALVLPEQLTL